MVTGILRVFTNIILTESDRNFNCFRIELNFKFKNQYNDCLEHIYCCDN